MNHGRQTSFAEPNPPLGVLSAAGRGESLYRQKRAPSCRLDENILGPRRSVTAGFLGLFLALLLGFLQKTSLSLPCRADFAPPRRTPCRAPWCEESLR